jgi:hypothetical protein
LSHASRQSRAGVDEHSRPARQIDRQASSPSEAASPRGPRALDGHPTSAVIAAINTIADVTLVDRNLLSRIEAFRSCCRAIGAGTSS